MTEYKLIGREDGEFIQEMLYEMVFFPQGLTKPPKEEILGKPEIKRYFDYLWLHGAGVMAVEDGKKAGAAWFIVFPDNDKGYGYAGAGIPELSVAVLPSFRGRGIGKGLMEGLLKLAKEKGHKMISLSVDSKNPAMRMYEKMGFMKISLSGTSWVMVKTL